MNKTKEQQRAADVWQKVTAQGGGCSAGYVNLAKGLPALIMNSGLLQVLAFLHEKGDGKAGVEHARLLQELREWLGTQWPDLKTNDFSSFMKALIAKPSGDYQRVTTEAFAWLRWMRQFAAANKSAKGAAA
jgi:CRISPR-associated protein Cmr5